MKLDNSEFPRTLSLLRQEKKVSQRTAAEALGISQALLSHYENGVREPGLAFVVRACDYYGVSADFLLGRTLTRDGAVIAAEELYDISDEKNNSLKGGVLALLSKKLLVNSVGVLFGLLGRTGSREAIQAAAGYLSTAVYTVFRRLYDANPDNNPDFFSVSPRHFQAGLYEADMKCCEAELADALAAHVKDKGPMPEMTNDALARDYPVLYQSVLQVVHNTGERVNAISGGRKVKQERK
ncbi:MAG: helix-turn-helix transcriptional regulator [Lawsonibacter sp.]|jgi:transcriptional regulator with XRE-family HTH domain|nr:helix-turn-helix transcriptional regulator [Lawsonibacter sp.]